MTTAQADGSPVAVLEPSTPLGGVRQHGIVRAVLLRGPQTTDAQHDLLLESLSDQSLPPDDIVVLTVDGPLTGENIRARLTESILAHGRADTANPALLLWVLPQGTVPEPDALVELLAVWRRSQSVALVGPKHVDVADPKRFLALDIRASRAGRLVPDPLPGSAYQGQADDRGDVLAVPMAGALVEAGLLAELGGWDRALGDVAADLDLGWRAVATGRRVALAPRARMRTRPDLVPVDADTPARRRAARRVALARAPWWAVPWLWLTGVLTALLATLALLLLKRPTLAAAEAERLPAYLPWRTLAIRHRTRTRSQVQARDIAPLFVPARDVRRRVLDGVAGALDDSPAAAPTGAARSSMLGSILRSPAVLAPLAVLLATVVAGRTLGWPTIPHLAGGLTGGEVVGGWSDASSLWSGWFQGWRGGGLGGAETPTPGYLALLAPLAWLAAHLPGVPTGSPGGLTVAVLLLAGMPLASVTAYLSARVLTRRRWPRAVAAVLWATSPVALAAVSGGRLGAVVALILLPVAGAGFAHLGRRDGTATSAFATAWVVTAVLLFVPALGVGLLALALLLVFVRRGARLRALAVLLLPAIVLGFLVPDAIEDPRLLLAGPGNLLWGGEVPSVLRLALLDPGGPGWSWAGTVLLGLGGLGLLLVRHGHRAAWGSAALVVLGTAATLAAPRVLLASTPAGPGGAAPVRSWPGLFMLVTLLGLLAAVLLAARELPHKALHEGPDAGPSGRALWARRIAGALLGTAALASLGHAGYSGLDTLLRPWTEPRPAVSVDHSRGSTASRALLVTVADGTAGYEFVGREAVPPVRSLPALAQSDVAAASTVEALLDPQGTDTAGTAAGLAVDLLAIRGDGLTPEIVEHLDGEGGLTRLPDQGGWTRWRVLATAGPARDAVAPARAVLLGDRVATVVPVTGAHGATRTRLDAPTPSRLVVAEPAAWSEVAQVRFAGRLLRPESGPGAPAYAVPSGSGELTITTPSPDRGARIFAVGAFLVLSYLAVPFGRRRSRVRR